MCFFVLKMALFEVNDIVTLFGDEYRVKQSDATGNYYLSCIHNDNNRIFHLLNIDCIKLSSKVYGYKGTGIFPEAKTLEDLHELYLTLANFIDNIKLIKYLQSKNALDAFIQNTSAKRLKCKYLNISSAFVWDCTPEGREYWENLDTEFKLLNHETQLQNETIAVRGDSDGERNCICDSGNLSESSAGCPSYEAKARKRKSSLGRSKVYLSTYSGRVFRS